MYLAQGNSLKITNSKFYQNKATDGNILYSMADGINIELTQSEFYDGT